MQELAEATGAVPRLRVVLRSLLLSVGSEQQEEVPELRLCRQRAPCTGP
jgi:hypothetical protein